MVLTAEQTIERILNAPMDLISCVDSITRGFHSAEDVFQEIFVTSTFEPTTHLMNWFREYTGWNDDMLNLLEQVLDFKDESRNSDCAELLSRFLQTLTPRSQTIVKMQYFEHRSSQEIADFIGTKVESVYQAVLRIHKTLKNCMERQLDRDYS